MGKYLEQRNGHFHYYRAIPKALQVVIGTKRWTKSLKTKSRTDAEVAARKLAVEHDALIASLQTDNAKQEYKTSRRRAREAIAATKNAADDVAYRKWLHDNNKEDPEHFGEDPFIAELNRNTWKELGWMVPAIEENYADRVETFDRLKDLYDQAFGPIADVPADLDERDQFEAQKMLLSRKIERLSPDPQTITAIAEKWSDIARHAPENRRKHHYHITQFAEIIGDPPITQIDVNHIREYRDHLSRPERDLKASSIQRALDSVHACLNWAVNEKVISANPAMGIKGPRDDRSKFDISWQPFSGAEMRDIFRIGETWWNEGSGSRVAGARRRDLLMSIRVLAYTGMRPEELCQLRPPDVRGGVIHIDDRGSKRVKTASSIRAIPIHPSIVDFQVFMDRGGFTSFEGLRHRKAHALRENFRKLLRKRVDITDEKKVLYSLRGTFADACREASVPEYIRWALMGHAEPGHAGKYGRGASISVLQKWIEKIDPLADRH